MTDYLVSQSLVSLKIVKAIVTNKLKIHPNKIKNLDKFKQNDEMIEAIEKYKTAIAQSKKPKKRSSFHKDNIVAKQPKNT